MSLRRIRSWLRRGHRYFILWVRVVLVHAQVAALRAELEVRALFDPRVRAHLDEAKRHGRIF